jgi:AraC-like DNA-binding protein
MGVLASLGDISPQKTFGEPVEAFRSVAGDAGAELSVEVEAIVEKVRAIPRTLVDLRAMLMANLELSIDDAARALSVSPRSLQRVLQQHGTSFHDEETNARFATAEALLRVGDDKVASIARRVGCSERTLTSLFRARTGLTPSDWRKAQTSSR